MNALLSSLCLEPAGWVFYPVLMSVYNDYLQEQADAAAAEAAKREEAEE